MRAVLLKVKGSVVVLAGTSAAFALLAQTGSCLVERTPSAPGTEYARSGSESGGSVGSGGNTGAGGTSSGGGNSGAGGGSSQYANFATVGEIVQAKCGGSGCHNGGTAPTLVGISDTELYTTLTTYVSTFCGDRVLVKPGSPDQSAFYLAQEGQCGPSLPQMPLGCVDTCTPQDYLDGVWQWIENGAPEQ